MAPSKCDTNFVKDFLNRRDVNLAGWIIAIIAIVLIIISLSLSTVTLFKDREDGHYSSAWYNFLITINIVLIIALLGVSIWILFVKIINKKDTEGDKIALLTSKIAEITADKITDPIASSTKTVIGRTIDDKKDDLSRTIANEICADIRRHFVEKIIPLTDKDVGIPQNEKYDRLKFFDTALANLTTRAIDKVKALIDDSTVREGINNSVTDIKNILKKEVEDAYNANELDMWISTGTVKRKDVGAISRYYATLPDTFYQTLTPDIASNITPADAVNIPVGKIDLIPATTREDIIRRLPRDTARILATKATDLDLRTELIKRSLGSI